jgi:hypothetical protein
MKKLQATTPPTPFLSKNEADVTTADLTTNRLIFIYSPLPHDQVVYKNNQFRDYLKTSVLEPLPKLAGPKSAGE